MSENEGVSPAESEASPRNSAPPVPPRPPLPTTAPAAAGAYGQRAATSQAKEPTPPAGSSTPLAPTMPTLPLNSAFAQPGAAATASEKKKSGAGKVVGLLVAAALVGGAAGLGGSFAGAAMWGSSNETTASAPTVVTVNDTDDVNETTAVASKVLPSVVTIAASSGSSGGTGSGVVISEDGYILTNTHVVTLDGATATPTISVTMADGSVYDAAVVGTDPTYDLAVIKLEDATGLTPIEFADSSALNVGDVAIAVGAPLGLSNTVTTGIVSALYRSIEIASSAAPEDSTEMEQDDQGSSEQGPFQFDFGQGDTQTAAPSSTIKISVIQTDAAINPGNSGGALVDDDGNLIGINVAIASSGSTSTTAGNIGVGFSIPSNIAERIANEIIETGQATHGLLGAMVRDAATVEDSDISGAYIAEVTEGGAAAAAGMQAGDVVTEFNGMTVTNSIDLTAQVRGAAAGSDATVVIVRGDDTRTLNVTLGGVE